jgi:DDE_Tnp_1-associated
VTTFEPLLDLLAGVSDPRRGQGQKYKLPHVLLFSILAIVTGCNSYRGIVTFIDVHRRRLNATLGLKWRRAPAHTAILRFTLAGVLCITDRARFGSPRIPVSPEVPAINAIATACSIECPSRVTFRIAETPAKADRNNWRSTDESSLSDRRTMCRVGASFGPE